MVEQEILEMLTTMVEDKDIYTAGHSKRVAMYSVRLAQAMGLSEEEQTTLYQAGLLQHFDFQSHSIENWEHLENHLIHSE
jgi:HD-GYP domain-containing protein (c-di-GMP phosphodiesterase class II)